MCVCIYLSIMILFPSMQKLAAGDRSASVGCLTLRTASSAVAAAATNFLGDFVRDSTCHAEGFGTSV